MALSETLYGKTPEQLAAVCAELGMPRFAAKQLARWLYAKHVEDPMRMSDIAAAHRAKLAERFRPAFTPPARITESADGTKKYLYRTQQGAWIESAYIPDGERATLCVSSQAGCRMGCRFCATGRQGLQQSLTAAEILNQAVSLPERDKLTNLVFMGMGEPMGNYKSVLSAVRQISSMPPEGFGISARNITVSTVGVVPGIRKLAEEGIPVRLAVSLHAPSDELRDELVPMNKRFNTKQVLDAAHDYYLASKRRVSIEYALMRGINDQAEHAKLLAKRLNHYGDDWAHVNPIPLNPIEGSKWTASKPEDERRFLEILHNAGITATLRDTRGQDIDGACGQLAVKERD